MKFITNLFKGRINRRNFLIGLIFYTFVFLIVLAIDSIISNSGISCNDINDHSISCSSSILIHHAFKPNLVYGLISIIFFLSLASRRLHDLGRSLWFCLLFLVPSVNLLLYLYLCFKEGQQETNKYGNKPSKNIKFPGDIFNL